MGIIRTQTMWGTFYTYVGAALGVLTNLVLLAWFFSPEQIGLLNVLVAYSLLFAQFANLGFDNVTIRLFPYFRNEQNKHEGYFGLMLKVILTGFLISSFLFAIWFFIIMDRTSDLLFSKLGFYVFPLILATLLFNSFDTYSRALYKSIRGTFLKEVLQRVFIIIFIGLYIFYQFSFNRFVLLYVIALTLPTIILFIQLILERSISFNWNSSVVDKRLKKEIISVSIFGIITVFSSTIVSNIDKIMIQQYLDLSQTGIYSIAYFFGVIISMPSRALTKISSTVIAEAWKKNELTTIFSIYYKSCINQMIFSLLLFIGIWANIDNLLQLLPDKYAHIHWVVFWIALGSFIDMSTGINNTIIATSPSYKVQSLFMFIFVIIIIGTNAIFIPIYGIEGAAFASALSLFVFNAIRWVFLWKKYGMQPFNYKFIIIIACGALVYLASSTIPKVTPFYIDLFLRSVLIFIFYVLLAWKLNLSDDLTDRIHSYIRIFLNRK
ncbi:MAG: oligosaccharide flippase family protein [Bacteroidales bacterium]|nr:oligosaccharide flippase family protein [Bacteroidales bacterium]